MGKITFEFETKYDKGDIIAFKKHTDIGDVLQLGIIEGYYLDEGAGNTVWYNVRMNKNFVYTYSNKGDICEHDVFMKIDATDEMKKLLTGE